MTTQTTQFTSIADLSNAFGQVCLNVIQEPQNIKTKKDGYTSFKAEDHLFDQKSYAAIKIGEEATKLPKDIVILIMDYEGYTAKKVQEAFEKLISMHNAQMPKVIDEKRHEIEMCASHNLDISHLVSQSDIYWESILAKVFETSKNNKSFQKLFKGSFLVWKNKITLTFNGFVKQIQENSIQNWSISYLTASKDYLFPLLTSILTKHETLCVERLILPRSICEITHCASIWCCFTSCCAFDENKIIEIFNKEAQDISKMRKDKGKNPLVLEISD